MDPVTICNMALGWIGAKRISTLNAEEAASQEEELLADQFEPAVRAVLEEKAWLFATGSKPSDLGAPQETGDPRFPTWFKLPPDTVSVLAVYDADGTALDFARREDLTVVTEDSDKAFAIVTRYIPDPKKWTPTFCRAVAARLAADIAAVITENASLGLRMEEKYLREVAKAGVLDGIQGSAQPMKRRSSLSDRRR
jgi:hypothetical protein